MFLHIKYTFVTLLVIKSNVILNNTSFYLVINYLLFCINRANKNELFSYIFLKIKFTIL